MTLVIDTSVIVKWFVRETGHEDALSLLETTDPLCCPDFALVEAANVLWRKTRGAHRIACVGDRFRPNRAESMGVSVS